ncbi:30S ribosomal protein S6 [Mycoplasmopsis gallopavonis]|uniref:Small ribosomal subunit protein bS6 n=1 Tax=Mycoplasmopsis gallopavonis TaxID=76629 RepID=A0A449AZX4_9BACT|nr:30S ribosomal protein S6 [Mycoplasmopsis gallopavonis]RIV16430.1 30S ribosomal protein S6 [Mycoplasmopsis gallopavonis]VEU73042.1 30S ribosomal protein S6 [Mycoplasmopsis gallopavonis]
MIKYEIMTIVDPKAQTSVVESLLKEVFAEGVKSVEKLENNELAYEINKSKHGQYVLAHVETEGSKIAEFTRRTNIIKEIWRTLVINLDSEKGLNAKPNKIRARRKSVKASAKDSQNTQGQRPYNKPARPRVQKAKETQE